MNLKYALHFLGLLAACWAQSSTAEDENTTTVEPSPQSAESEESNENKESDSNKIPVAIDYVGCGYRKFEGVEHTFEEAKNFETKFGEFPWMVALFDDNESPKYECGGALIAPSVAITTASCVFGYRSNSNALIVRAGDWDLERTYDIRPHQNRRVHRIIALDHFNIQHHMNDIAILILESPFDIDEHIQPICLPAISKTTDNLGCILTSWGIEKASQMHDGNIILRKVDLATVLSKQCENILRTQNVTQSIPLHESVFCVAGEKDQDVCPSDRGSPLVCTIQGEENRYYLAGIVSTGIACGMEQNVGLFTDIALFQRWIVAQLSALGISLN